jgi:hypothetical protein
MKRNTVTLIALLVILGAVAYLVTQKPGEQSSSGLGAPLLHIDSVAVDKLEIRSLKAHVVLEKRGAEWYLKEPIDYKADQSSVGNFIHEVKSLEVKNVVSNKPEKFSVFQVDTTSGTFLAICQGGIRKDSILVGKIGASYSDLYVRRLPSDDVDAVDASIQYQINRGAKEWRDKTILTVPKENIKEIKYQYGDTTFTLVYQDSVWLIGKNVIPPADVNGIVGALANFQADDFIDTTIQPAPKINVLVSYAGNQLRFSFLKTQNKYAVQSSNSPQWFVVETWRTNSILKRKKDLVKLAK